MKVLHLPLKAQWFTMIESGRKKEEYREIKDFWLKRFCLYWHTSLPDDKQCCFDEGCRGCFSDYSDNYTCFPYDHVLFRYGYTKRTMLFKIEDISIGRGRPEWGAPDYPVFIIKLGERIE